VAKIVDSHAAGILDIDQARSGVSEPLAALPKLLIHLNGRAAVWS
jgi:hypothetical protein